MLIVVIIGLFFLAPFWHHFQLFEFHPNDIYSCLYNKQGFKEDDNDYV